MVPFRAQVRLGYPQIGQFAPVGADPVELVITPGGDPELDNDIELQKLVFSGRAGGPTLVSGLGSVINGLPYWVGSGFASVYFNIFQRRAKMASIDHGSPVCALPAPVRI